MSVWYNQDGYKENKENKNKITSVDKEQIYVSEITSEAGAILLISKSFGGNVEYLI